MSAPAAAPVRRRRRIAGWAALVLALVAVGLLGSSLSQGGWAQRQPLDPESAGPEGARAIARVLAAQGVEVRVVRERAAALDALTGEETLLLPDAAGLDDDEITELVGRAEAVVLAEPRSRTLGLLLPGSRAEGSADDEPLAPACDLPAAESAGDIFAGDVYSPGPGVEACYPGADGSALLAATFEGTEVVAVDARTLMSNDRVARAGNAALALSLLGRNDTLVWYVPSLADAAGDEAPTLGELTPDWVTPAIVLLLASVLAAAVWRGRRFGPLVAENLPVTVRADETTLGRGRLYENARDPAHAIDQLRNAVRPRLARRLGLPAGAPAADVADAAAHRLGADRAVIRRILVDDRPADDRELVALSDRLTDLEARLRAAAHSEGTTP